MELRCPQCGKLLTVSQEEVVIHDSQVVCPQCLAVCRYEGGKLVARDDSDAPYRHTTSVNAVNNDNSRFCHSCGKHLPSGISFCPYCGANLGAPFDKPKAEPEPKKPEPAPEPQPVKQQPAKEKEPAKPSRAVRKHNEVEDKLRTMSRHYNSVHPRLRQNGTMPSKTFKIVAYCIIALLLALLVYIIIAGLGIETTT